MRSWTYVWAITFCVVAMAPLAGAGASEFNAIEEKDFVGVVSQFLSARVSLHQPAFTVLSVDSLGLGKTTANAIRQPKASATEFSVKQGKSRSVWIEYRLPGAAETTPPMWRFELREKEIRLISQWDATHPGAPLTLDFEPLQCHATLLGKIDPDSFVRLPAILHLPDQGPFRVTAIGGNNLRLGYDAGRVGDGYIRVTFPTATAGEQRIEYRLEVTTIHPSVAGIEKDPRFNGFRRNWLNTLQLNPRLRVLANNAGSDICAFCVYEYADIARYSPPLARNLNALDLIRQTLDRVLEGMLTYGMPNSPIFDGPLCTKFPEPSADTYPSLLIAAREYVTGSGDDDWLAKHYNGLQTWTRKMLATDCDGNGLIKYVVSGNSGSWAQDAVKVRPANWWDTIGFGHEDAYANALAYRALRGMTELAARLHKTDDAAQYRAAADKLRAAYFKTFYNPATGVLAGWRSADGQLHDYYFLFVNGAAIHYGLVPRDKANAIMDCLMAKLKEVGYTRFDLGLPGNLVPVARKDYVHLEVIYGGGKREDNSEVSRSTRTAARPARSPISPWRPYTIWGGAKRPTASFFRCSKPTSRGGFKDSAPTRIAMTGNAGTARPTATKDCWLTITMRCWQSWAGRTGCSARRTVTCHRAFHKQKGSHS